MVIPIAARNTEHHAPVSLDPFLRLEVQVIDDAEVVSNLTR